jgi:hypothetical protein
LLLLLLLLLLPSCVLWLQKRLIHYCFE